MATRAHYLLVNQALFGREFGFVDIWQACHQLSSKAVPIVQSHRIA
jgi:hypothetical protein